MSASRRGRGGDDTHENEERWLLTYSDMITLLMALFIVMWAISSVNISKFNQLKAALKSAFSAQVLPANTSILPGQQSPFQENGSPIQPLSETNSPANAAASAPTSSASSSSVLSVRPIVSQIDARISSAFQTSASAQDAQNLNHIRQLVQRFAAVHGLEHEVSTQVVAQGLIVRILTDNVLFASGQAQLQPASLPLLREIAHLLAEPGISNPVEVEGNTDNQPIHSALYPSNWELSSARADAVLEDLLANGVAPSRLSATGFGDVRPIASNATASGRAANRRVDIVILRRAYG